MPQKSLVLFHSLLNDNYNSFVKKLFNYHSLINVANEHGETLLHYCAYYGLIEQYYALTNIGAEIKTTNLGNTLLHYASLSGKDDYLVVDLVKSGLSPLDKNIYNETPLHLCANERIAHYFNMWCLRNKINICDLTDENLNTVAHGCKIHGNIDGAHYWLTNYNELKLKKNIFNKTWQQCKKKKQTTCLY